MIRSELVLRVAQQNPHLYETEVEALVNAILGRISEALVDGDRVELRGLGTFEARKRDARPGRNPRTGAVVEVEAKTAIHFRAAKAMRAQLNPTASSLKQKVDSPPRPS
jgi:integration host factor subunit beta